MIVFIGQSVHPPQLRDTSLSQPLPDLFATGDSSTTRAMHHRRQESRGSKNLNNNTGSVNFLKPLSMTPPLLLLPKIAMLD